MENQQINTNPETGINPLEKYGINLTGLSKEGKIDPVIGREDEIHRDILSEVSKYMLENPEVESINIGYDNGVIVSR